VTARARGAALLLALAALAPGRASAGGAGEAAGRPDRGPWLRAAFWGEWIPSPWAPSGLRPSDLGLAGVSLHVGWRFPFGLEIVAAGVRTAAVVAGDYASAPGSPSFQLSRVPSGTLGGEVAGLGWSFRHGVFTASGRLVPGFIALHVKGQDAGGAVVAQTSPVSFTLRGELEGCAIAGPMRFCAFFSPNVVQMGQAANGLSSGLTVAFSP
jgi:hypothetical protein